MVASLLFVLQIECRQNYTAHSFLGFLNEWLCVPLYFWQAKALQCWAAWLCCISHSLHFSSLCHISLRRGDWKSEETLIWPTGQTHKHQQSNFKGFFNINIVQSNDRCYSGVHMCSFWQEEKRLKLSAQNHSSSLCSISMRKWNHCLYSLYDFFFYKPAASVKHELAFTHLHSKNPNTDYENQVCFLHFYSNFKESEICWDQWSVGSPRICPLGIARDPSIFTWQDSSDTDP